MIWFGIGACVQIFQYLIFPQNSDKIAKCAALLLWSVALILIFVNIWPSSKISHLILGYFIFAIILKRQVKK